MTYLKYGFALGMVVGDDAICFGVNFEQAEFLRRQVLDVLLKLALQQLHVLQVVAQLISGDEGLSFVDPEHDLVALTQKLHEDQRLLQFDALVLEFVEQQRPQAVQLFESVLNDVGCEVALCDHLVSGLIKHHDGVRMRGDFRFERLMFLDLGLEIGRVFV